MDVNREQFDAALAELFGAFDKPFSSAKADGFWRGLERMSWVQFCRARDQVLRELENGEAPRTFTVGHLWGALKRLRASAPEPAREKPWFGDEWDTRANLWLLAHIRTQASKGVHYCSLADRRPNSVWRSEKWKAGEETTELTAILVKWKNAWARDCREGELPPSREKQLRWWSECMLRADAEVTLARPKFLGAAA